MYDLQSLGLILFILGKDDFAQPLAVAATKVARDESPDRLTMVWWDWNSVHFVGHQTGRA